MHKWDADAMISQLSETDILFIIFSNHFLDYLERSTQYKISLLC